MELTLNTGASGAPRLSETEVRRELAIVLYQREKLSLGRAAQLAGMKKFEFNQLLADRGIPMHYGMEELKQDLATARSLAAR
jgi:predicted HTH domain antitoxin